jgi:hypothetical protein
VICDFKAAKAFLMKNSKKEVILFVDEPTVGADYDESEIL